MRQWQDAADQQASLVDVELLDVLAQIEALLRSGRELQRELLRIRGVPRSSPTPKQRKQSASRVRALVRVMATDARALTGVVGQLRRSADRLDARIVTQMKTRPM